MEFILLVFVNIIMGTIFYLILRLKLEKYASDFREKRLKREMDEIIYEFNETAERNISLLENRIEYLRKLLEKTGTINNIDFSIDDNIKEINTNSAKSIKNNNISGAPEILYKDNTVNNDNLTMFDREILQKRSKGNDLFSRCYLQIKGKINKIHKAIIKYKHSPSDLSHKNDSSLNSNKNLDALNEILLEPLNDPSQSVEILDIVINDKEHSCSKKMRDDPELSEVELEEMFSASEDKYVLISELYNKGYPSELISRCSGIPMGEIKLVLDLNTSL